MLIDEHGLPDHSPVIYTPSDGLHFYFRQPPDGAPLGNSRGALPPGIDVRGSGGYVIASGATLPDGRQWSGVDGMDDIDDAFEMDDIPEPPAWLVDTVRAPKHRDDTPAREPRQQPPQAGGARSSDDAGARAWAKAALDGKASDLAATPQGGRDEALNASSYAMGTMITRGWIGHSEVVAAFEEASVANGFTKEEGARKVRDKIHRAIRDGMANPHPDLPERNSEDDPALAPWLEHVNQMCDEADSDYAGYGVAEDAAPRSKQAPGGAAKKAVTLNIINAASLAGLPVPDRRWLVEDMIPEAKVTLLYGDGGSGKSLLALQLACSTALGSDFLGYEIDQGRVLYLSCEDEIDEHHRRLDKIAGDSLSGLTGLDILDMAGEDAVMSAPDPRGGLMLRTPFFIALRAEIEKRRPSLVVIDNLADVFGGDEIKKLNVRQFCTMLNKLAREFQMTLLVLAHPSVSGMTTGSGTSGNVAWSNSVRSRLLLERKITREAGIADEDDPNIRILTTKKSNGAAVGAQVVIRWEDWTFVRDESRAPSNAKNVAREAEHVFMQLLRQFEREGRSVSNNKASGSYAPKLFAEHHGSTGIGKRFFEKAMNKLFEDSRIKIGWTEGPPSKRRPIIVETDLESYASTVDEMVDGTFDE